MNEWEEKIVKGPSQESALIEFSKIYIRSVALDAKNKLINNPTDVFGQRSAL